MVVSIEHPKGGVGKSLMAFNIAVHFSNKKYNVEVIDLDGQKTITSINKFRVQEGLNSLVLPKVSSQEEMIKYLKANKNFDDKLILVDTGGFDSELNRMILAASDIIISPVSTAPVEIIRLVEFNFSTLEDINRGERENKRIQACVLLNKIHPNAESKGLNEIKESLNEYKNLKCLNSVIRVRSKIENSVSRGYSIFDKKFAEKMKSEKDKKAYKAAHKDLLAFVNELEKMMKSIKE